MADFTQLICDDVNAEGFGGCESEDGEAVGNFVLRFIEKRRAEILDHYGFDDPDILSAVGETV